MLDKIVKIFNRKIYINIFLALIILMGLLLRCQELVSNNYLFLIDQGRDLMDVKKIIFDHKLTLIGPYTSLGGVFQGPLWYYLLAIPLFITSGDPVGAQALMLAISISVIFICYWFSHVDQLDESPS